MIANLIVSRRKPGKFRADHQIKLKANDASPGRSTEDHDKIVKPRLLVYICWQARPSGDAADRPVIARSFSSLNFVGRSLKPCCGCQKAVSDSNKAGIVTIKIFASSAIDQFCA